MAIAQESDRHRVEVFRFIEMDKAAFPVAGMCRVLEVSRPAHYAWRRSQSSPRQCDDERLTDSLALHGRRTRPATLIGFGATPLVRSVSSRQPTFSALEQIAGSHVGSNTV